MRKARGGSRISGMTAMGLWDRVRESQEEEMR